MRIIVIKRKAIFFDSIQTRKMAELKFLGIDFGCALGSISKGEIPEKDCLLPLISKLLGYCIVAASTTVKLPQV